MTSFCETVKLHGTVSTLEHGIWGTLVFVPRLSYLKCLQNKLYHILFKGSAVIFFLYVILLSKLLLHHDLRGLGEICPDPTFHLLMSPATQPSWTQTFALRLDERF